MCLVLAADSWQRAVMQARLRSLIWAGVWVGLGFQAKMLQAWMILPALGLGYLLAAPGGLGCRLRHLGVAGLVMLAVSLSWIALYTFTPAADRPYVDGSTDNSAVAMVLGYNGVERFGVSFPGAVAAFGGGGGRAGGVALPTESVAVPAGHGTVQRYNAGGFLGSSGGWTKLADARFGPEIGWLYPLALLTLIAGLAWRGRARRTDQPRAGLVMWGTWLLTFGVIYSLMNNIPHTAYMASLAPPLAALSGAGIVLFWRWYRSGNPVGWLLPAAVAVQLAWACFLWSGYRSFLPWALPAAIVAGVAAIVVMVAARLPGPARRVPGVLAGAGIAVGVAGVVGVAAMLAAPTAWSASVLDARYAGSSLDASAGPAGGFGPGGGGSRAGSFRPGGFPRGEYRRGEFPRGAFPGGEFPRGALPRGFPGAGERGAGQLAGPGGAGGGIFGSTTLTSGQQQLYHYVSAHRDGAGYLLAVQSWTEASAYILATGQEVLPMGGFSGSVPEPTLARVRQLVAGGQLRFFLLGATGPGPGRGRSAAAQIASWVESSCSAVPAQEYGATSGGTGTGGGETLYECGSRG
jgi:4-amino-4-deoxy-L-arabinose transferase-like glycosyltransferase